MTSASELHKDLTRSQRIHDTQRAVARQVHIAAVHGASPQQPGRLRKHHSMEVASPVMGNPRHSGVHFADDTLTAQEKRHLAVQEDGLQEVLAKD